MNIREMACLWASCFGQLSTCLLRFFWCLLIPNVFLRLTCNNKAKSASFPRQKYHRDFLRYWAVKSWYPQFLRLQNPVCKIAITSCPTSSSFTSISCSLLRIIFCFSRSRALSAIIFSLTICHLLPWEICQGSSNIHLTWLTYVWPSTNRFLRTLHTGVFWQVVFQTPRPHSLFWTTAPPPKF